MKFASLPLQGAYLITPDRQEDHRGYFARTFCIEEFEEHGLITQYVQMSTSYNEKKGQIRGMHYQQPPYEETKLVRCTRGAIFDVMLDLREDSPTCGQWHGDILSAENGKIFYIPKGFAHGFQTLEDSTELFYMMDTCYNPQAGKEIDIKKLTPNPFQT